MKNFIKIIALVLALSTVALLGACDKESSKYSYWKIERYELADGEPLTYYAEFNVQRENQIREIWINVDNFVGESIKVGYFFGSNVSGEATVTKAVLEKTDGWYRISANSPRSVSTIKLVFTDTVRVNEVVVVDTKDKLAKLTLKEYGEKATSTSNSRNKYTAEQLETLQIEHSALCAIDEQDIFDLNTLKELFESAVKNSTTQLLPNI